MGKSAIVQALKAGKFLIQKGRQKMKKVVALLLIAVMAIGFVSCGKNASGDVPTLVWYLPGEKQADVVAVNEAINAIIEPEIGAKIDLQYIASSDFTERLRLVMASQDEFDLCFTGFANPYLDGVRRGGFYEMSDLLEEYGEELSKSIPDYLWEAVNVDGEIYAVPCYQAMTQCAAIYFNKALVEKYGFDTSKVKKMEDIVPFLETIRDNEKGNFFPMQRPTISYFYEDPFRYEATSINYVYLDRKTNELVFMYDIPEIDKAQRTIKEWNDAGFFNPDISASTPIAQVAVSVTTGYRPGDPEDRARQAGYEIIAVPISDFAMSRSTATTTMTAISATSKNPEKAMQMILQVNVNPEVFNLCAYGIEGKHYEKIDENHIKLIPDSGYAPDGNWKFGNMFIGYLMEGYQDDLWEVLAANNDKAKKELLIGFVADVSPVSTYISNIATAQGEYAELLNGTSKNYDAKMAERAKKVEAAGKAELMKYAEEVVYKYMDEKGLR